MTRDLYDCAPDPEAIQADDDERSNDFMLGFFAASLGWVFLICVAVGVALL